MWLAGPGTCEKFSHVLDPSCDPPKLHISNVGFFFFFFETGKSPFPPETDSDSSTALQVKGKTEGNLWDFG